MHYTVDRSGAGSIKLYKSERQTLHRAKTILASVSRVAEGDLQTEAAGAADLISDVLVALPEQQKK